MPTNLTDRLGELVDRLFKHIEHGDEAHRAWLKGELEKFFAEDEILSALRKAEEPVSGYYAELVERLGSHMGKADIEVVLSDCREAATAIERLTAREAELREALSQLGEKVLFKSAVRQDAPNTDAKQPGDEK